MSSRLAGLTGAVLLGGVSSRMGRDKAALEFRGKPMATRAAERLAAFCDEVLLVGGDPPQGAPGRRVADPEGECCALRGLVGALEAATGERVLVVATDLPLLTPELLLALVAAPGADIVVPRTARGLELLCALYHRERCARVAREHLESGRLALHELPLRLSSFELLGPDLAAVDPGSRALTNVNTPAGLRSAANAEGPFSP